VANASIGRGSGGRPNRAAGRGARDAEEPFALSTSPPGNLIALARFSGDLLMALQTLATPALHAAGPT